jgi:hypothetical protein
MDEQKQPKSQEAPTIIPVIERDSRFSNIYINNAQVGFTGFDVYMVLSEAAQDPIDQKLHVYQKARISMSPMQALILATFLGRVIKNYETQTGIKVEVPKTVFDPAIDESASNDSK